MGSFNSNSFSCTAGTTSFLTSGTIFLTSGIIFLTSGVIFLTEGTASMGFAAGWITFMSFLAGLTTLCFLTGLGLAGLRTTFLVLTIFSFLGLTFAFFIFVIIFLLFMEQLFGCGNKLYRLLLSDAFDFD